MVEHTYPSQYPPGTDPDLDSAWEILDHIKPGAVPDDVRAFLAGAIVGLLHRVRREAIRAKEDGPNYESLGAENDNAS